MENKGYLTNAALLPGERGDLEEALWAAFDHACAFGERETAGKLFLLITDTTGYRGFANRVPA
ncbi:MAG: hypothetical protein WDN04_19750 [Rhodospirillales bacterium]